MSSGSSRDRESVERLVAQKNGALIVLERETGLKSFVETG